ncbi:MAG: cupin domain-containing protein [Woeseia sp.]
MSKAVAEHLDWESVPLETVNPMMQRRIITGELMTVARIWFKDGFKVPRHSHHNEQITQVVSGVLRFRLGEQGEQQVDLGPGEVLVIPAHLPHEALCIGDVEEVDLWAPRRDDWLNKSDDYLRQ